jgi:hypothetical protein
MNVPAPVLAEFFAGGGERPDPDESRSATA